MDLPFAWDKIRPSEKTIGMERGAMFRLLSEEKITGHAQGNKEEGAGESAP
jgi:hypothetical protein